MDHKPNLILKHILKYNPKNNIHVHNMYSVFDSENSIVGFHSLINRHFETFNHTIHLKLIDMDEVMEL